MNWINAQNIVENVNIAPACVRTWCFSECLVLLRLQPRYHKKKMRIVIQIAITAIVIFLYNGCKPVPMKAEDFSYVQQITDSVLITSSIANPSRYVYGERDSVLFKAEINQFNKAIDSLIEISSGAYKKTYREMALIINEELVNSDSVNLNSIRTTKLIIYPIHDMVLRGELFVYDKTRNEIQDSIWVKDYYGESLYQNKIRSRFYEGKLFATKQGKEFLNVELRSGH